MTFRLHHLLAARLVAIPVWAGDLALNNDHSIQLRVSAGLAPASPLILPIRG